MPVVVGVIESPHCLLRMLGPARWTKPLRTPQILRKSIQTCAIALPQCSIDFHVSRTKKTEPYTPLLRRIHFSMKHMNETNKPTWEMRDPYVSEENNESEKDEGWGIGMRWSVKRQWDMGRLGFSLPLPPTEPRRSAWDKPSSRYYVRISSCCKVSKLNAKHRIHTSLALDNLSRYGAVVATRMRRSRCAMRPSAQLNSSPGEDIGTEEPEL